MVQFAQHNDGQLASRGGGSGPIGRTERAWAWAWAWAADHCCLPSHPRARASKGRSGECGSGRQWSPLREGRTGPWRREGEVGRGVASGVFDHASDEPSISCSRRGRRVRGGPLIESDRSGLHGDATSSAHGLNSTSRLAFPRRRVRANTWCPLTQSDSRGEAREEAQGEAMRMPIRREGILGVPRMRPWEGIHPEQEGLPSARDGGALTAGSSPATASDVSRISLIHELPSRP
jgi:hypothetical protein